MATALWQRTSPASGAQPDCLSDPALKVGGDRARTMARPQARDVMMMTMPMLMLMLMAMVMAILPMTAALARPSIAKMMEARGSRSPHGTKHLRRPREPRAPL